MNGPAPQAIFFDMDGTILDWQTGMEESWRIACVDGCHARDGIDAEELLDAVHARRKWFWAHPEHSVTGRLDLDAATHMIVTHALADLQRRTMYWPRESRRTIARGGSTTWRRTRGRSRRWKRSSRAG